MLGLGVVLWRVAFAAVPLGVRLGMPHPLAWHYLPIAGFVLGLALGAGTRASAPLRQALLAVGVVGLCGAVGWFFGLLAGLFALALGAGEPTADYAPAIGFFLGLALGALPIAAGGHDSGARRRSRRRGPSAPG
jgi:hypothetical protein